MNPNHNNELEALIDRELKSLPPLTAPASLAPRVLAAIAARQGTPWYRTGWQTWPLALRVASFTVLAALFAGLCFGSVQIGQSQEVTAAGEKVSKSIALFGLAGKTLAALADAALQIVRHVGTGYVIAALALIALAYAGCVAFGSFYFKFAFGRR